MGNTAEANQLPTSPFGRRADGSWWANWTTPLISLCALCFDRVSYLGIMHFRSLVVEGV